MVQGLKFLSKKSFHPQNRVNQKRVWEREQEKQHEQTRIREREAQLRREREDEELATARGVNKVQFLYDAPPGLETASETTSQKKSHVHHDESQSQQPSSSSSSDMFQRQQGDDDAAAAFRKLFAQQSSEQCTETDATTAVVPTFGTVLQGSNADRSNGPKPLLTALEKSVGRKNQQNLTFDEQIQRFPALANAPRAKGLTATDVGVTFHPLGTQIRNVRCLACGIWGHSRGDRECSKTGWDPFAAKQSLELTTVTTSVAADSTQPRGSDNERKTKRRKNDSSSSDDSDDKESRRRHKKHQKSRDRSQSRKKHKERRKKSKKV